MKIFIGGVPLEKIGVTQNELGWYYWNGSSYYKPTLAEFNTATLPTGYKKYTDGSHTQYLSQRAIDFTSGANKAITFDEPVSVVTSTSSGGSYCKVRTPKGNVFLVHTDRWKSGGVPAFEPVCYIKDIAGSHLHIFLEGGWIRDIILGVEQMQKGDRIEWTKDTNIRQGNGISYPINATAKQGAVATLRSSEVRKADGYDWMDVEHPGVTGWAVTKNMAKSDKKMTNVDGTPIAKPKTCEERIQEAVDSTTSEWTSRLTAEQEAHKKTQLLLVETLDQKKALETELQVTQQELEVATEEVEILEGQLDKLSKLLKEAADTISLLRKELEKCQQGASQDCVGLLARIANKILEWLNGNKVSIDVETESKGTKEKGTNS